MDNLFNPDREMVRKSEAGVESVLKVNHKTEQEILERRGGCFFNSSVGATATYDSNAGQNDHASIFFGC